MNKERVFKFINILSQQLLGFNVKFKNESTFMKIIGKLMFYNPNFMTSFITTIGKTVYFPNKESLNESDSLITIAHEFCHATDAEKIGRIKFSFLYLFPQIISIFTLLLIPFYWPLALILFFLFLLPFPAIWRKKIELRGYIMTLFMVNEILKENGLNAPIRNMTLFNLVSNINNNFISFNYYKMWPFGVTKELNLIIPKISSGEIIKDDVIYKQIADAFSVSK